MFSTSLAYWLLLAISSASITDGRHHHSSCHGKVKVRKEWGSLTKTEKLSYISAVKCMQTLPPETNTTVVPGARSRHDDFIALHINMTRSVHLDGIFLSWHRNYVHLWETALEEECGYPYGQPYWNWALWCDDLAHSPLFDGSETSLSGDGAHNPDQGNYTVGNGGSLPHANGGGCVTSGPFVNQTISFGPFDFALAFTGLPSNWTTYTPHCLVRDLNNYVATRYGNQTAIDVVMNTTNVEDFQNTMSGADINLGPHGGGHFSIGYSLLDFFASPADPAFFLHHGMIDRLWMMWQVVDEKRVWELSGTSTIFNGNDTPEVTLETMQTWGVLGKDRKTKELLRVGHEGFCYEYM
ncbi:Di-copper centre-containing protein [Mollisia scopiformis]|uniref:Di-copper centre-containing protein n=1 Tax=Mollisia scopiformis TaxID=149040 RepID=A0A194X4J9_MOLSC|nr:Di-copper centre-containing protein [Mollisia scopiformis]KUJ14989.1 Di-copper centre-containing protein [Mollisia scopiformis]